VLANARRYTRRQGGSQRAAGRGDPRAGHGSWPGGSAIVFIDNRPATNGISRKISRTDEGGNTPYQLRWLNGVTYEVVKNFPTAQEPSALVQRHGDDVQFVEEEFYAVSPPPV